MDYKAACQRESHSELEPRMCQKSCHNSKMSNKTYIIPSDPSECSFALPHSSRRLDLSPEPCCVSASPDTYSISSLGETEDRSSPYINTECCFEERTSVCGIKNSTLPQGDAPCVLNSNMGETFNAMPVNGSREFWNKTFSCIHHGHTKPETDQTFNGFSEDRGHDEVASSDSAGMGNERRSGEGACRGSSEKDCFSMSFGEMVIRSNSFCVEEQSLIAVSPLEESHISPATSHLSLPGESNPLSTIQPDVWEKSTERATGNAGHPCLGVTFIQTDGIELLSEELDIAASSSLVALPGESEGGLLRTFICGGSTDLTNAEVEQLPHFSGEFTPEHGKTFVSSVSAIEEGDDIHSSTPVFGNKMPPLPSFSPCIENASKPGLQPLKRQPMSATPKQHLAAGLTPALGKVKKMETPKSHLRGVKCKFTFKSPHQVAVQSPASQPKSEQVNASKKPAEGNRRKAIRMPPAKVMSGNTADSPTAKMLHDSHGQGYTRAANVGLTATPLNVDGQAKMKASSSVHHPAVSDRASAVQSSESRSETLHSASSQHAASQSCASLEKSPARSGQMDPKPTPKKDVSNKIGVRTGSALCEDDPSVGKIRNRCSSESSMSRPPKQNRSVLRVSTSFTVPKGGKGPTKPENLNCSSQKQVTETNRTTDNSSRVVKIISLLGEPGNSPTAGAPLDDGKSRSQHQSSPRRGRGTPLPQSSAASPRATPLSAKQREEPLERAECRIPRTEGKPLLQQKKNAGSQRPRAAEEPFQGVKTQLNGTRPPQTPNRPSFMGPPLTPASRIPRKTQGLPRNLPECSGLSELNSTPVSGRTSHKPTQLRSDVPKKPLSTPGRNTGPALTATCKPSSSTSRASHSTVSTVKRTTYSRTVGPTLVGAVDKTKPKASSCQQKPQQQSFQPSQAFGSQNGVQSSVPQGERKDQNIQQLERLLTASDRRFQAVAVVLQQVLAERDEATRQCRELSEELVHLQGELASSVHSSECLEKEKEELRVALQDATHRLQEQHQRDLAELEQRLQTSYKAEWDKVHLTCLEEANKCKALMQQQMEELKANHDAMKLKLESSHEKQLQCVKQQYEMSLEELRKVHCQELQRFDKTSKDVESSLCREIQELTMENKVLIEKLAAEENRRRELAENTQKDSQTLYLEQELESLKVVLDLKNKQLHQQEKKLMEVNKLTDKNVKLEETLTKVKQENEDLKARMERHAALSRQLSSEQATLQENLQKESKVNKRLSMENEELLWKLHNGDLSSPRKTSPTSPSHSFKLQSPRSSGFFSSPPVSPR